MVATNNERATIRYFMIRFSFKVELNYPTPIFKHNNIIISLYGWYELFFVGTLKNNATDFCSGIHFP